MPDRKDVYYWKCDRSAAFHGTSDRRELPPSIEAGLRRVLGERFPGQRLTLSPGGGQGNHLTWNLDIDDQPLFVRVEHGPEQDSQLAIESSILEQVAQTGVPVPKVAAVDVSRREVPFAWQVLTRIPFPDLNHWFKEGTLDEPVIAEAVGRAVATWQEIRPSGFGPHETPLACFHARYESYFRLRLPEHLAFLQDHGFLAPDRHRDIAQAVAAHRDLLQLESACLVHKDLALWNVLGSPNHIAAFIDFDDAIGGDPMDDLSLLACFHDPPFLAHAFRGYASVRPLPPEYRSRFWLHLLRNMLVKAVIRVGAGYFERTDRFFLIPSGGTGDDLRRLTHERLQLALDGLSGHADPTLP